MNSWLTVFDIGLQQGLIYVPASLGFAVAYRFLRFPDLTVEASVMLGGAGFAMSALAGFGILGSLLAAVLAGGVAGLTTSTLHRVLNVNKFLAGILVIAFTYTVGLRMMKGSNLSLIGIEGPLDRIETYGGRTNHALLLAAMISGAALLVLCTFMILRSPIGMRLRAAGSNPGHSEALGIRLTLTTISVLCATNGLAALSGALLASNQGFADVSMGQGVLVLVLASLAIGERSTSWLPLQYIVAVPIAAVVGAVLYETALAAAVRAGLPASDLRAATALIVLFVVVRRQAGHTGQEELL